MRIIWCLLAISLFIPSESLMEVFENLGNSLNSEHNQLNRRSAICQKTNGIYTLKLKEKKPFGVLCKSGWTMVLNRFDGQLNFYRDWQDYKDGFGNLSSEFFIGLDKLHAITAQEVQEVLISLQDFDGTTKYAIYDEFLVGNETDFYAIKKLGNYRGNAGDSLSYHLDMKFSTYDKDNDNNSEGNCAIERMGAWWYNWCNNSHLFGMYLRGNYTQDIGYRGITWWYWRGPYYSYKKVQMFVRSKYLQGQ